MAWQTILDIAVVLVAVYLVMAIIASGLVELVGSWLNWRAKTLKAGIGQLLADPGMNALAARVWAHPLVSSQATGPKGPSYIEPKVFGMALTDIVKGGGGFAGVPLTGSVAAMVRASGNDPLAFKANAEQWFDGAMERVSGAYKRKTHVIMLVFSLGVAALLNIDSIQLITGLARLPPGEVSGLAVKFGHTADVLAKPPAGAPAGEKQPEAAPVPPDQPAAATPQPSAGLVSDGLDALDGIAKILPFVKPVTVKGWIVKILGWMITAVGASLGTQFWFGLLQNMLRLSGRKPGG